MKNRTMFLSRVFMLLLIVAVSGCGRKKDAHNSVDQTPVEQVAQDQKTEDDGCKMLTEAICVLPGDEGKCLAYSLKKNKICQPIK